MTDILVIRAVEESLIARRVSVAILDALATRIDQKSELVILAFD